MQPLAVLDHIAACVGLRAGSHPSSPRSVSNCVTGAGQNTVPVGEGVRLAVGLAMNVCELVEVAAELVVPLGNKPDVSDGVDDPLANGDIDARAALTLNVCTRSPLSVKCFKREPAAEKSCNRAPVDRAAASARLKYTMEDKTKEAPRSTDHHASPFVALSPVCTRSPVLVQASKSMRPSTPFAAVKGVGPWQHHIVLELVPFRRATFVPVISMAISS